MSRLFEPLTPQGADDFEAAARRGAQAGFDVVERVRAVWTNAHVLEQ